MISPRTTSKGVKRYAVRVGNKSLGTFGTLAEARQAERDHYAVKAPTTAMTVEQLVARYLDLWTAGKLGKRPTPSTVQRRQAQFRALKTFFPNRELPTIKPTEAEDFATTTVAAAHAANALFHYAVSRHLCEHNWFPQFVKKPGPGRATLDPLTDAQVSHLQSVVEDLYGLRMGAMVPFWAYSGLRSTELYSLDWSDIDWKAGEIHVRISKTGPRKALLLDPAREAIEPFRGIGPVFTTPIRGERLTNKNMSATYTPEVRKHFKDLNRTTDFDWYELRHFNAHLLYARMSQPADVVAAHLGNSPEQVMRRYGHYKVGALDRLREAAKAGIPRDVSVDSVEREAESA